MIDMLIEFPLKSVGIQYMMGDVLIRKGVIIYLFFLFFLDTNFWGEKKRPSTAMDHC